MYHITIRNRGGGMVIQRLLADNVEQPDFTIPLVDDRSDHHAEVDVG
jgi:hypothetical protein